ncbi:MAG: metal-dependent transcriptional regulator [Defluviitaleaceae bacterium]|nr:metal-dependent transcriptional regulator [Defluviitaleaceae bacterium]
MKIQASAENYLETIYVLSKSGNKVRSVDISAELDYTRPSVSVAMKKLRRDGYIDVDASGYISLTERGCAIARSMHERHTIISNWLISLGVDEKTAVDDACRIEHVISEKSFEAIKRAVDK